VTIHSLYIEKIAKKKDLGYNNYGEDMKKNKAFTLVELIAVITILAVILVISLPSLLGTIEKTGEKRYQDFLDNLYMMTENYVTTHFDEFPDLKEEGARVEISISKLREAEYFRTNPINPKTDKAVSDLDKVVVTRTTNKTYSYEFITSSTN